LSVPALEVLAIIAYFQPVTRAYIEQLRGVESSYTVGILADRGLVENCGRLAVPGRPMLYRTTHVFLRTFGLESLDDLPQLPHVEPGDDGRESIHNAIKELKERQKAEQEVEDVEAEAEVESETETETEIETEAETETETEAEAGAVAEIEADNEFALPEEKNTDFVISVPEPQSQA
jgi:segregation and condensation protein B